MPRPVDLTEFYAHLALFTAAADLSFSRRQSAGACIDTADEGTPPTSFGAPSTPCPAPWTRSWPQAQDRASERHGWQGKSRRRTAAGRTLAAPAGRGCRRPTGKSDRGTKSSTYNGALLSITNTNSVIVTFTLLVRSQIASMPVIFDHNNHCFPLSISRTRFPPNWSSHFSRFLMVEHFWFQNSKF